MITAKACNRGHTHAAQKRLAITKSHKAAHRHVSVKPTTCHLTRQHTKAMKCNAGQLHADPCHNKQYATHKLVCAQCLTVWAAHSTAHPCINLSLQQSPTRYWVVYHNPLHSTRPAAFRGQCKAAGCYCRQESSGFVHYCTPKTMKAWWVTPAGCAAAVVMNLLSSISITLSKPHVSAPACHKRLQSPAPCCAYPCACHAACSMSRAQLACSVHHPGVWGYRPHERLHSCAALTPKCCPASSHHSPPHLHSPTHGCPLLHHYLSSLPRLPSRCA